MEKKELLTKGKAKELYKTVDETKLVMDFTDDTSAFDGKKIEQLAGKGTVNNRFNNFIMNYLEKKGVACHLLEELNDHESLVLNLDMFPIECVVRIMPQAVYAKDLVLTRVENLSIPYLSFSIRMMI
jgi:phosphoribosylaminoimidazole-succinocarboxamide synthase